MTCMLCRKTFPALNLHGDVPVANRLTILVDANPDANPFAKVSGYLAIEGAYCKPCWIEREMLAGGPV